MTLIATLVFTGLIVAWSVVKDRAVADERAAWVEERRELLNRIQHPEVVVPLSTEVREVVETEPDEINLVGEIVTD